MAAIKLRKQSEPIFKMHTEPGQGLVLTGRKLGQSKQARYHQVCASHPNIAEAKARGLLPTQGQPELPRSSWVVRARVRHSQHTHTLWEPTVLNPFHLDSSWSESSNLFFLLKAKQDVGSKIWLLNVLLLKGQTMGCLPQGEVTKCFEK